MSILSPCSNDNLLFDDYDKVKACLKSPLRDLHQHASIIKEFQDCNNHIDHHLNKIVFIKCEDSSCCSSFQSKKIKEHFNGLVKFPSPSESKQYQGRFNTCIKDSEMKANPLLKTVLLNVNTAQPFVQVENRKETPYGIVSSKAEHKRKYKGKKLSNAVSKVVANRLEVNHRFHATSVHQSMGKNRQQNRPQHKTAKAKRCLTIADAFRHAEGQRKREMITEEESCAAEDCKDVNCRRGDDDEDNEVHFWIQCRKCSNWFHTKCVALELLSEEELENYDFVCVKCN